MAQKRMAPICLRKITQPDMLRECLYKVHRTTRLQTILQQRYVYEKPATRSPFSFVVQQRHSTPYTVFHRPICHYIRLTTLPICLMLIGIRQAVSRKSLSSDKAQEHGKEKHPYRRRSQSGSDGRRHLSCYQKKSRRPAQAAGQCSAVRRSQPRRSIGLPGRAFGRTGVRLSSPV